MSKRIFTGLGIIFIYSFVTGLVSGGFIKFAGVSKGIGALSGLTVALVCVLFVLKWQKMKLIHWGNIRLLTALKAIGTGFLLMFICNVILRSLFSDIQLRNQNAVESMIETAPPALMFVLVVIVGPILEEIVFRGVFMKLFFPKHQIVGALIASVLFALAHNGTTPLEFITYFIPGVIFGFLAYRYKGIEYAVVYHMFTNSLAFLLLILKVQ